MKALDRIATMIAKSGSYTFPVNRQIHSPLTWRICLPTSIARWIPFFLLFLPGIKLYADATLFIEAPINF